MASRKSICENCISVCKAPQTFSEESLLLLVSRAARGLRGRILGTHTVPGAESDTNLTRWIVWFESAEDVSTFLTKLRGNRVEFEGHSYTVTYEKTIPCEIPESWTQDYVGDRGQQQTYPRHMSQKTEEPEHRTPPRPPRIFSQQAAYNRLSHEGQHNVNHPQHQYMVSGYYQNIPPDAQIKVGQKNEGMESNKQPGLHGNLPHNHQLHDQGFQHNVGEDYSQGQGRYTTPVSGQVPFQGQVLGRGHMSSQGLYPQLNEMSGLHQPPQQGVVHGQGFVQPMGRMPDQGLSHQLARMPGQFPQRNIMFGPGQVPPEGQMSGENQFVQQRMMPFQVHVLQHPDMHGQSQAPNQGGIPSQGLSPQQKDDTQDEGKAGQGQALGRGHMPPPGLYPQLNEMSGLPQPPQQGVVHGQGFVQPMGRKPDQRPFPQHNKMFGPVQVPQEGKMSGENQFVQQRMMPFQVHVPQYPVMHGQSQAPNQGGIPSQGLSPQQKGDIQDEGKAGQGKAPLEGGILAQGLFPQQNIISGQSHAQAQEMHSQSLQESEMPGQDQDPQQDQTSDQGKVYHQGRIPGKEQAQSQHLQMNFNAPSDFQPGNYQNMAPFGMLQTGIPPHFGPGQAYNSGGQNVPFPVGMMPQYIMGPRGQLVPVPGYSNLPTQQTCTIGTQEYEPQRENTPHKTGGNVEELDDGKDVPHSDTYNYDEEYNQDREELIQEPLGRPTKIVVSNLPSSAHEYLEMFFENTKKYGGGAVKEVVVDEEANSAIIEFEECDAVDVVLSKRPVKIMGQKVDIDVYIPEPPVPLCTIEVQGPPSINEQTETIEMYFDSKRKSLEGIVTDVRYDSQEELAYDTFETEENEPESMHKEFIEETGVSNWRNETSFNDGVEKSAEAKEMFCQPCNSEGDLVVAVGYCQNCNEYLCALCLRPHHNQSLTKHHVIHKGKDMPRPQMPHTWPDPCSDPCSQHMNEIVKYFCSSHDAVGCIDCMVLNHRSCKTDQIQDISDSFFTSKEHTDLCGKIDKTVFFSDMLTNQIQREEWYIDGTYKTVLNCIKAFRKEVNDNLDKAEANILREVNMRKQADEKMLSKLKEDKQSMQKKMTELKERLNQQSNKANNIFVAAKEMKKRTKSIISSLKHIFQNCQIKQYKFEQSPALRQIITCKNPIGKLTEDTTHSREMAEGLWHTTVLSARERIEHSAIYEALFTEFERNCTRGEFAVMK